jgi:2-polyprenyl-3-methyl-5-hydroxy-6-metoxy-1,4-benzoquinol methylase
MTESSHPEHLQIIPDETSRKVASFSRDWLVALYRTRFAVPEEMVDEFYDFELRECESSELVYAYPVRPGSDRFYSWLVSQPGYYAAARWEWQPVIEAMSALPKGAKTLDIGCGTGAYLKALLAKVQIDAAGADAVVASVRTCRELGLTAYEKTAEELVSDPAHEGAYDAVTMFHVVEHIADPVATVRAALGLLKPHGTLYISTPFSPMLCEIGQYHPLNLPPHHTTRWTARSYEALAQTLDCSFEFTMPRCSYLAAGLKMAKYVGSPAWKTALRPQLWLKWRRELFGRPKVNGHIANDEILVTLRRA